MIRWGILGAARIAAAVVPAIQASERCEVVAIASRSAERAAAFAERWDIPITHSDYAQLLADDRVDVVYNPLPNHLHAEWTVRATEAGKHVLCEKPIALTLVDVDTIAATAKRAGRIVAEAFMYRHHLRTAEVRRLISGGEIGPLRSMHSAFSFSSDLDGNYRLDPSMGGGSLWDVGCYPISFARFVMGTEPHTAFGVARSGLSGVDLGFAGTLVFDSNVVLQFDVAFDAPRRISMAFVGSDGWIELPEAFKPSERSKIIVHRNDGTSRTIKLRSPGLYRGEVENLADAILGIRVPEIDLHESRGNVAAILALYRSADQERPIHLDELGGQSSS